ncbi:MAG TPA: IclR family transcriptional regulator [Tepidiformaceae bacterium]|mgnify:FL=1|jgi:DNA-binding IclR family transcriptional regulator|nr:IclR family transcriptional regulator [Tepidiformaceae bacterium]
MPAAAARTLTVLSVLAASAEPLTVAQISARTGIARASVSRLLDSLCEEGGITTDGSGRFTTSLALWRIGAAALNRLAVRDIAFPYLTDISGRIPAHVTLCVPEYPNGIAVESWHTVGGQLMSRFPARTFPLLTNAAGRVIAAHESEARREALLAVPLKQRTPLTRTDPGELRAELDLIRRQGYATIDREDNEDVSGFAVPLLGPEGTAAGSIGFGRTGALEAAFVQANVPVALGVAERISWELGWRQRNESRVS